MRRTAEIVLSIIGMLIYGLLAVVGGAMIWMENNQEEMREFFEQEAERNPQLSMEDFELMLQSMGPGGWLVTISSVLAIILGIIALILLRGNKNPKAAGILLIVTSVAYAIVTVGVGIIPGAFYLIAGVMCLVRKPQKFSTT